MLRYLIEKPMSFAAGMARSIQAVADRTSMKAARVADSIQSRLAEAARARALAAARKPGIYFVRDLKHNSMRISFYKHVNRRGEVRFFWTLNRDTPGGRVRLATGNYRDLKNIREALRPLYRSEPRLSQQQTVAQERPQTRQERPQARAERPYRPRSHQERAVQERTQPKVRRPEQEQLKSHAPEGNDRAQEKKPLRWYSVVQVVQKNRDGTVQVRVIRSYSDYGKAQEVARDNPKLAFLDREFERPPWKSALIDVQPSELKLNSQKQQRRTEGPKHENGQARERGSKIERERYPRADGRAQKEPLRWYSVVQVEGKNRDGTMRVRIYRNYSDYGKAMEVAKDNPKRAVLDREWTRPPSKGKVMNVKPSELRLNPQKQQRKTEVARDVNGQAIERGLKIERERSRGR
ncbi:MAG: hypothetical protein U0790_17790 [Isosphaeraceae bacterium]